jgi:hydrogenase-4 component B
MALAILLWCILVLLGTALVAVVLVHRASATPLVYVISLIASTIGLVAVVGALVTDAGSAQTLRLPLGLPWLGAHLRLDPLAAAFLVVVNLGAATASLYGLGDARAGSRAAVLSRLPRRHESRGARR